MHVLEKLYDCADSHLSLAERDWDSFCSEFCSIFNSEMVLYRMELDYANQMPKSFQPIITSKPDAAKEYADKKLYMMHPVPEVELPPLEPLRRTDFLDDEAFKSIDVMWDFSQRHGYHYQLIAPAILSDGSFLGLVTWRDQEMDNFDELDKQRITLFMRHLLAKVELRKLVNMKEETHISDFGKARSLTNTEIEVLTALLDGHSLRTIAENTGRTYGTVRWHVQNILSKCQVSNQKTLIREFYHLIQA